MNPTLTHNPAVLVSRVTTRYRAAVRPTRWLGLTARSLSRACKQDLGASPGGMGTWHDMCQAARSPAWSLDWAGAAPDTIWLPGCRPGAGDI